MIKQLEIEGGAYAFRIPVNYFPKFDVLPDKQA